jgi:hypothetical protein
VERVRQIKVEKERPRNIRFIFEIAEINPLRTYKMFSGGNF